MPVAGLSSKSSLKNCLFFRLILRLNVLSTVHCSLSTPRGMIPYVALCLQHTSLARILLLCNALSSSSQYGSEYWNILATGAVLFIASWYVSRIASAVSPLWIAPGSSRGHRILSLVRCSPQGFVVTLFFQFGRSLTNPPVAILLLVIVERITARSEPGLAPSLTI